MAAIREEVSGLSSEVRSSLSVNKNSDDIEIEIPDLPCKTEVELSEFDVWLKVKTSHYKALVIIIFKY